MSRLLRSVREYPLVATAIVVGFVSLILQLTTSTEIARWPLIVFAAVIVLKSTWSMIQELRRGVWGIDLLAITAVVATLLVSEYWAAWVVVLMITSGEALEGYADRRARKDLTSLVSNAPAIASVIGPDGTVSQVDVGEVSIGARVLVRAADIVPFDGVLLSEVGVFDDSSLTGESLPQERVRGDEVLSGAINGATAVEIEVTRVAADSQYQRIVALVTEAAESRAPMVRLADRYAVPFTLVSLTIAGLAWALSGDPMRFAQVLVVATPCPLLIGAPVAFMAGMSRAARSGVIIRSSGTLEKLHRAATFAFDKTGTLTHGAPELVEVRPANEHGEVEVLTLAAAAEQASAHVLAGAIVAGAAARGIVLPTPENVTESLGGGVTATVDGINVAVGKAAFVNAWIGGEVDHEPSALTAGELAVHVGIERAEVRQMAGILILRDELRPDAAETLTRIRSVTARLRGVRRRAVPNSGRIMMLTGDGPVTAQHIAAQVGVDDVRASLLPADKLEAVQQASPRPIVMVGDGVNDAPVLAAADVGIAMAARGSTAASESADVVILPDEIGRVADALTIGRDTINVALQSIWIGIVVSLVLMLFATTGHLPAFVGAWLQEGVDVLAILWALRAGSRHFKNKPMR